MLLPIAREHRGGRRGQGARRPRARALADFGDRRTGFHAQEFLRNAFAAIGVDRERIARLEALVPPDASAELLFSLASRARGRARQGRDAARGRARARSGRDGRASSVAIATSRRTSDDPDLRRACSPAPSCRRSRSTSSPTCGACAPRSTRWSTRCASSASASSCARRRGSTRSSTSSAPRKISLPNDYRALLAITNGMRRVGPRVLRHRRLSRRRPSSSLRAQRFAQVSAKPARPGSKSACRSRAGARRTTGCCTIRAVGCAAASPATSSCSTPTSARSTDLRAALGYLEHTARDMLGTN